MSGAELARWRSSWAEAAEVQWAAAGAGRFKESAAQFLSSSWQGDALAVRARLEGCIACAVEWLALRHAACTTALMQRR